MKAKDLAKQLGVSPATISLVLNGKPGISDPLRASLLEKIEALGCGDMCKAAPEKKQEQTVPAFDQPAIAYLSYLDSEDADPGYYFPGVLEGAEVEARSNGFGFSILHRNNYSKRSLKDLLTRRGNVVGAIVQATEITEDILRDIREVDIPFVFMDVYDFSSQLNSVRIDNFQSMRTIVDYLKTKGHRNIGYVSGDGNADWQKNRRTAFRCALADLGLEDRPEHHYIASSCEDPYEVRELMEQFSRAGDDLPTAMVCENDRQAVKAVSALYQLGIKVPDRVSVVGFDNSMLAKMARPALTTVKNSSHLMGRECVMLLQNLLRLKELGVKISHVTYELPTQLVERSSVKDISETE